MAWTHKYVDSALGTGDNDGSTPANSWRGTSAIKVGFETDHDAETICWFRRTSAYDEGVVELDVDIVPITDGSPDLPVIFAAWPMDAKALTQADWTNGSTTVDNVVGATLTRNAYQARMITAPDGNKYFITMITDANTLIIDREYSGPTVTGVSGACSIDVDEFFDIRPQAGIDAGWDADADGRPTIDFNNEVIQLRVENDDYLIFSGFDMYDSSDGEGVFSLRINRISKVISCLFKQNSQNARVLNTRGQESIYVNITVEGSGAGSSQTAFNFDAPGFVKIYNAAIYNMGDNGLRCSGMMFLSNVNIGVEQPNGDNDIGMLSVSNLTGIDVKLGGTNGYVDNSFLNTTGSTCKFENFGKVLGEHKAFHSVITSSEKVAVTSTNANKKLSDDVLKISPNRNFQFHTYFSGGYETIFDGSFELSAGSKTIRFWLFNDLGQTLNDTTAKDNVFLRATYVNSFDDSTEYTMVEAFSTQIDILDAADADDWDYLEVVVNPSTASKIRIELCCSVYNATTYFLIDPKPVIT